MNRMTTLLSPPDSLSSPFSSSSKEDHECRVALLLSKGVNDSSMAESLLLSFHNDVDDAFQYFEDLTAAALGTILPPTPLRLEFGGFENAGNS